MVFRPGETSAQAMLVPCIAKVETIDNLVVEANGLWQAEAANAKPGSLHKSWGCVGALFNKETGVQSLAADWTTHFQKVEAQSVSVVNKDGLLDISWPNGLDGQRANFDVILATATRPVAVPPTTREVADAWIGQRGGHENYFFNNVKHGIRTPDDLAIWRRIEEHAPPWLESPEHEEAITILRTESESRKHP